MKAATAANAPARAPTWALAARFLGGSVLAVVFALKVGSERGGMIVVFARLLQDSVSVIVTLGWRVMVVLMSDIVGIETGVTVVSLSTERVGIETGVTVVLPVRTVDTSVDASVVSETVVLRVSTESEAVTVGSAVSIGSEVSVTVSESWGSELTRVTVDSGTEVSAVSVTDSTTDSDGTAVAVTVMLVLAASTATLWA